MSYLLLVLGVALWAGAHLFKRVAPARRETMGDAAKGVVSLLLVGSIVLMVIGYRGAEFVPVWQPPAFLTHLNNLLMLLAVYLFLPAYALKTAAARAMRHPMLIGVKTWALAHLLVKGDLASIILFGGILAWAVVSVIVINRAGPRGALPPKAGPVKEVVAVVAALVLFAGIGWLHQWLGPWPYG